MVTIENIRDLNAYLCERFADEPTVRVHIVTDECPGDTVAVEVTPDNDVEVTPDNENAYAVFFGLDYGAEGVDALIAYTYGVDHEGSGMIWTPVGPGVCEGPLMSDTPDSFDELAFDSYMVDIFGPLYPLGRGA